jgi:DNA-binding GntR family transcriptional regulator
MIEEQQEPLPLDALERVSTTEHVLRALRSAIVDGRIAQGEQLREAQLARALGTGRSAVREALRQLVQEGIAQHEVHRGTFVRAISAEDVVDLYRAREAVETHAISLILAAVEQPDPAPLRACLARMEHAAATGRPWREMADADVALHETLVARSGSPRLGRMFATLAAESRMHLYQYPPYSQVQNVVDHEQIVAALEAGSPDAEDLLREHLRYSAELVVAWRAESQPTGRA